MNRFRKAANLAETNLDHVLRSDEVLKEKLEYLQQNPVRRQSDFSLTVKIPASRERNETWARQDLP
jgi:hypothetical protein